MRNLLLVTSLALMFGSPAFAQAPANEAKPALTAQQEKMKTCNADAATQKLAGPARKTFMSNCLKGKKDEGAAEPAAAPAEKTAEKKLTPQQEKMKTCNADAKTKSLKGAERSTFMSTCLKG